MNDLPLSISNKSTPLMFADDTGTLFTPSNTTEFDSNTCTVFETINKWFKKNCLSLNFEKPIICALRLQIGSTVEKKRLIILKIVGEIKYGGLGRIAMTCRKTLFIYLKKIVETISTKFMWVKIDRNVPIKNVHLQILWQESLNCNPFIEEYTDKM